jgi:hypothetical protein
MRTEEDQAYNDEDYDNARDDELRDEEEEFVNEVWQLVIHQD